MKWNKKVIKNGASLQIIIPKDLALYLNIEKGDILSIQDDNGKFGKFGSFWLNKKKGALDDNTEPTE